MKKIYTLFISICITAYSFAQNVTITPSGITPATGGIPKMTYDEIKAIASPERGDLVIDTSYNTLRMWNGTEWTYFTSGLSKDNVLLTGYSVAGDSLEYVTSIDFDDSGNRYITGLFNGSATFGSTTLNNPNGSLYTAYVAKQNADGEYLWVKTSTGTGGMIPIKIRLDNSGNIFLGGYSTGANTLWDGGGSFVAQENDVNVIKLNNNGIPQWSRVLGGSEYDTFVAMDIDLSGDLVITGTFDGTASFVGNQLISNGQGDIFVARISNSTGSVSYLKQLGGAGNDFARDIKVNSLGHYILAGSYGTVFNVGGFPLNSVTPGKDNFFITTLNPVTNIFLNVKSFGNDGGYQGFLEVDTQNNVYFSGVTDDSLKMSSSLYQIPSSYNKLSEDEAVFILKFDASLNTQKLTYFQGDDLYAGILKMSDSDELYAQFTTGRYIIIGDGSYYDTHAARSILCEIDPINSILIWSDPIHGQASPLDLNLDHEGILWSAGIYGGDIRVGNTRILGVGDYYEDNNQIDGYIIKAVK
ncbi:hypothetical protein [Jiulongibacter sediminis]|uniref:Bulb-type lectin domain-containing protein n=1 Tax=Jiulongibacter sediminis TaxID=1605367 RepID=A0A0P7BT54_9BACT|nr:hypothetical protein [Jiulongibacter sediminis]KPM47688.1 hypothetical protein AFM12_14570 [Jiulongibacter sediminis]TBX23482.1 hypothetical protein TK44_14580 [Jiulongibacter sediminis]